MSDVTQVTVNPQWKGNLVNFDGRFIPVLSIQHPQHGRMDFMIYRDSMVAMVEWWKQALDLLPTLDAVAVSEPIEAKAAIDKMQGAPE